MPLPIGIAHRTASVGSEAERAAYPRTDALPDALDQAFAITKRHRSFVSAIVTARSHVAIGQFSDPVNGRDATPS